MVNVRQTKCWWKVIKVTELTDVRCNLLISLSLNSILHFNSHFMTGKGTKGICTVCMHAGLEGGERSHTCIHSAEAVYILGQSRQQLCA